MNCATFITLICCIEFLFLAPYVACWKSPEKYRYGNHYLGKGSCKADALVPWSYTGKNGPKYWGDIFPTCSGQKQSPIAINSLKAVRDPGLGKLFMNNYDIPIKRASIENDGHTVQVQPTDGVERTISVKGSTYSLEQLHFHWGDNYHQGSEHTIDGIQYALEMHLVHRNANNQIAVVAVLFQEKSNKNGELNNIIKAFPRITYRDMRSELPFNLHLDDLLPANPSSFYRYSGSLTTPECTEGVWWSVLTKPVPVSKKQMTDFRKLLLSATKAEATSKCKLVNNFRPLQPINHRTVYISQ